MNGAHDMGGMQSFGPIRPDKDASVFHARWEGRIAAIYAAVGALGKWNQDFARQMRESFPTAEYLALDYYQLRYAQTVELLVARGIITRAELVSGRPASGTRKAVPAVTAGRVAAWFAAGNPKRRDVDVAPLFSPGQTVRACPAMKQAPCLLSHGRRKRSPWQSTFQRKAISLGKNGPPRWRMNSTPLSCVVNPTTVLATTNTGWLL